MHTIIIITLQIFQDAYHFEMHFDKWNGMQNVKPR